ncbi:hypothetical protein ACCD10_19215 [Pseudomonas sp. Pseusp122]|uniref:hypothetical protein n=1 Tax=unclassified Pseudomonas TaxID=196821 RepID=UPI0039A4560C
MLPLTRRFSDLPLDLALPGHVDDEARAALAQLLTEQLHVSAELLAVIQQVRWKLRAMAYSAVKALFENLDRSGQDFLRLVSQRLSYLDRKAANSVLVAHTFDDADFSDCFAALHERSRSLSQLISSTQQRLDQAFDSADYATVNLLSEIVHRAGQLLALVEMNIPAGSPKARRAATSRTPIGTEEIWPVGPAVEAGMMFM